jgi:Zn-dependent protease with chaperone function
MKSVIGILALCLLLAADGKAQEGAASGRQEGREPAAAATPQSIGDQVPVPEPSKKALSYYRGGNLLWIVDLVWGLLIPALFLYTGFSARIRNWAQRLGRKWFFLIGIYFTIFSIFTFVIDLPLSIYGGYVREHAYGLSNQTFGKWFSDELIELLIAIVAGFLFLWVPYLLLRKSPRRWWLYTGLLAVPALILVALVTPIWIAPLFNKFGPMQDKKLEAAILRLADRAGIAGSRVYEVNKSEDTNAVNAYVTGIGQTRRIVLWDTIIAKLNEPELLFVMGHEMGHYVLGHIWKSILFYSILIMATLYLIHRTAGWLIDRYGDRFGFDQLSDVASLPLIILLFSFYLFIITPITNAYSRHNEFEADRFGLELTKDNRAAANAFVKLQAENLGVPRPGLFYKLWRADHPTLGDRIDFSNNYRPWEKNEPLVYGHLFRDEK